MTRKKLLYPILLMLIPLSFLPAQVNLHVVSREIDQTFPYRSGIPLQIEGEKATISIQTWEKEEVSVQLKLTAKHPERAVAEEDLDQMAFVMEERPDKLFIRNFRTEAGKKARSELQADYLIRVPVDCPVNMTNFFGRSDIRDLNASLEVRSQFGPVGLANLDGDIDIYSSFGDIVGEWLRGRVKIESQRSDLTLKQIEGTFNIQSRYGVVKIFADKQLVDLDIDADRSDVYLFNPEPGKFGYELTAHFGNITTPKELKLNYTTSTEEFRQASFDPGFQHPNVSIRINYGDIVIRNARP